MKLKPLSTLLIVTFGIISIFGFVGLNFSMDHAGQHNCFVFLMSGNDCPSLEGFAFVLHHLLGFQQFTQFIARTEFIQTLLFVILALFMSGSFFKLSLKNILNFSACQPSHFTYVIPVAAARKFLRWLALHRKRDSYLLFSKVHACFPERNLLSSGTA